MEAYSYTRLNIYRQCPRRYRARYLDGLPERETEALLIGREAHELIAAYLRHLVEERLETDVTWSPPPGYRYESTMLLREMQASVAIHPERVVAVEEAVEADLGGRRFLGYLDLLELSEDTPIVTDWKSDQRVRTQAEVERDLQMRLYACLVRGAYGYNLVRCREHFLRFRSRVEMEAGAEVMDRTEEEIAALVRLIEGEREWAPTPGTHCAWCPQQLSEGCPAVSESPVRIGGVDDARRLAGEILVLEKQLKDRKDALRAWTAIEGPVQVGGAEFGHFESRGVRVVDWPRFMAAVELAGEDPYEFLSVDGRRVARLLRGQLGEAIRETMEETISTTFRSRRAREGA